MDLSLWSIKNLTTGQWKTDSMSCTPKPMIHSCDTGQQILFLTVQYTTYPPPPPLPKTFCLSIVSNFSWGGCNTQEKRMQNFRGQKRCLTRDVQVAYSKLNTDCTCLGLWAHSTSTNIKRWTNGQMSQPKDVSITIISYHWCSTECTSHTEEYH